MTRPDAQLLVDAFGAHPPGSGSINWGPSMRALIKSLVAQGYDACDAVAMALEVVVEPNRRAHNNQRP